MNVFVNGAYVDNLHIHACMCKVVFCINCEFSINMTDNESDDGLASQLNLCQQLHYKICSGGPHDKLDSVRCFVGQLLYSKQMEMLSPSAANCLITEHMGQYMNLMDSSDTISGVENYAEEALFLAKLKKTEINQWKSNLPTSNVSSLPFVRDFLTKLQGTCTLNENGIASFMDTLLENCRRGVNQITEDVPAHKILPANSCNPEIQKVNFPQSSVEAHDAKCSSMGHRPSDNFSPISLDSVQSMHSAGSGAAREVVFDEVDHATKSRSVLPSFDFRMMGTKRKQFELEQSDEKKLNENSLLAFRTAKEQLVLDNTKSGIGQSFGSISSSSYGSSKKCLGTRRSGMFGKFVPPIVNRENDKDGGLQTAYESYAEVKDDRLKNIEEKMIELIRNEIMDHGPAVAWTDIAGLDFVKKTVKEIVVLPMLRPDIFTGLRGPPKGLLLFGPPGTGKTLIGKCIASNSKSTFFSISASSLTSKWIGEGEKMVRALFAVARCHQPAVIFIDEIDSLLTQRSDSEHESSRRMKTEFLIQLDGATTNQDDKLLVVGATNRPHELDEAARRRLVKRLYVPLPELEARMQIIVNLLSCQKHSLQDDQINKIGVHTEGYSGADMANLCKEAALGPIRCLSFEDIEHIPAELVRPIIYRDFLDALHQVKASVSKSDLQNYVEWNDKFGSTSLQMNSA